MERLHSTVVSMSAFLLLSFTSYKIVHLCVKHVMMFLILFPGLLQSISYIFCAAAAYHDVEYPVAVPPAVRLVWLSAAHSGQRGRNRGIRDVTGAVTWWPRDALL